MHHILSNPQHAFFLDVDTSNCEEVLGCIMSSVYLEKEGKYGISLSTIEAFSSPPSFFQCQCPPMSILPCDNLTGKSLQRVVAALPKVPMWTSKQTLVDQNSPGQCQQYMHAWDWKHGTMPDITKVSVGFGTKL